MSVLDDGACACWRKILVRICDSCGREHPQHLNIFRTRLVCFMNYATFIFAHFRHVFVGYPKRDISDIDCSLGWCLIVC